ncbi:cysteine--tRNA ligase [Tardibacter chloracetimidivorans]|uniref:Cysteine--tRNA ligase n=1 Tax=Tardibacter chloracetimidivorans TaxID=1921510 RepID=A0A1L3ZWP7_9SPHN|nr:cysteine--tRNA ligase [Tardibacter chloracetimidivorans]API60029.1 cysteine--tRNA ligase [Tardibacter chloracetimidivorans]
MTIRLYDTMAREKRAFEPADPSRVTMYVCGPTVYNRAHIGNARPAVVFDVLARLLRHRYGEDALVYARNVTDVDDKINAAAAAEGVDISVVTARYEKHYLDDMAALGVAPPDVAPRATAHIDEMIAMIARLIESGHAYAAEGHVLFHVPSDPDYGQLSRRTREAMQAGARVEIAPFKRDAADFVLWKPSPDDLPGWESPWGRGRPGWHIECSAMIEKHLGETIDIHAGGQDLIFPHHENEIAQSRCAHHGAPLARYWMHNGFVSMDTEKMSKSLGNVVTVADLLAAGHKGETLRLALLSAHYRQPLDWNDALLEQSKATLDYFYRLLRDSASDAELFDPLAGDDEINAEIHIGFELALSDDLNTPAAIAYLYDLGSSLAQTIESKKKCSPGQAQMYSAAVAHNRRDLVRAAELVGLLTSDPNRWFHGDGDDSAIGAAIAARNEARKARNFAEADRIRDELKAQGIELEDGPEGTSWRRA